MEKVKVNVKLIGENAKMPTYGSEYSAGMDMYAKLDDTVTIAPNETVMIPTGVSMEIPVGYVGLLFARSGLGVKKGLAPANKVGVIDSDYRGEIQVALHNHSGEIREVAPNDRIAQMALIPFLSADLQEVDELNSTDRSVGGFGSTGR